MPNGVMLRTGELRWMSVHPPRDWRNFYGWMRPELGDVCRVCRRIYAILETEAKPNTPVTVPIEDLYAMANAARQCGCRNHPDARLRR